MCYDGTLVFCIMFEGAQLKRALDTTQSKQSRPAEGTGRPRREAGTAMAQCSTARGTLNNRVWEGTAGEPGTTGEAGRTRRQALTTCPPPGRLSDSVLQAGLEKRRLFLNQVKRSAEGWGESTVNRFSLSCDKSNKQVKESSKSTLSHSNVENLLWCIVRWRKVVHFHLGKNYCAYLKLEVLGLMDFWRNYAARGSCGLQEKEGQISRYSRWRGPDEGRSSGKDKGNWRKGHTWPLDMHL